MKVFAAMIAMLAALGSAVPIASAVTVTAVADCCCATSEDGPVTTEHADSCATDCSSTCALCCSGVTLLAMRLPTEHLPMRLSSETVFFVSQEFGDATAMSPPVPPPRA
ncbi:MAG: hypothetical protein ACOVMP_11785 [Chthoniobacterales bacterium]